MKIIVPPALIYFPPDPPPLDGAVIRPTIGRLGEPAAPALLAAFVNERFYAPLSTLLLKKELSGSLRRRLDVYRAERDALASELKVELTRLEGADPGTRQRELAALAGRQAARLAALDREAEELRRSLVDGFWGWFAQREWHLGERAGLGDSPSSIEGVMRAYAAYHNGLTTTQRGLLREIALEVFLQDEEPAAAGREFLFSPEMSRVRLPEDLPPELAARIAEYTDRKGALKRELYNAVYDYERASALKGNTLKADVVGQGERIAALEKLAEEIRIGLAALPRATSATAGALPPVMKTRVAAFVQSRAAVQAETVADIEAIHRATENPDGPIVLTYVMSGDRLTFTVSFQPVRETAYNVPRETRRKAETATLAMTVLADTYRRRFATVAEEEQALRHDLAAMLAQPDDPDPETVLAQALQQATSAENAGAYRDYRTAVFEPGLSIEQRRLLFGDALMALKLPLPPGSMQPVKGR
jgi:hypothetical protein